MKEPDYFLQSRQFCGKPGFCISTACVLRPHAGRHLYRNGPNSYHTSWGQWRRSKEEREWRRANPRAKIVSGHF